MDILLISKLRDIGSHTIEALHRAGHQVQFTEDGHEALAKLHQREFDCVVISYSLSNETIKELTELLRQHRPSCPTVVISENGNIDWELAPSRTVHPRQGAEALLRSVADLKQRTRAD